MPQAVVEYATSKDFGKVDFVKQNILNLYENDIETQPEYAESHKYKRCNKYFHP